MATSPTPTGGNVRSRPEAARGVDLHRLSDDMLRCAPARLSSGRVCLRGRVDLAVGYPVAAHSWSCVVGHEHDGHVDVGVGVDVLWID